jgi:hypothetical protein
MLALLLAQMVVLLGLAGGVFEGCFFNRPRHPAVQTVQRSGTSCIRVCNCRYDAMTL